MNRFLNNQHKVPFTMRNVYVMLDIIYQTREQNLDLALVEAIDNYTMYTHSNRFNLPGWKTNSGHMLNKKFIINDSISHIGRRTTIHYNRREHLEDLVKVLCNLTGHSYSNITHVSDWIPEDSETNTWYNVLNNEGEPVFFDFKFYKKGTVHIKFIDMKVWELLNRKYAEIKGQDLPEKI